MDRVKGKVRVFYVPLMAVFVTLLLACAAGADSPIPNLITNPGFEGTYSGGVAPNWVTSAYGDVSITYSRNTSAPHSGTSCQQAVVDFGTGAGGASLHVSPMISLTAGHTYQMSVWARTASSTAKVQIIFRDYIDEEVDDWQRIRYACKTVTINTDWQLITCTGGANYSSSEGDFFVIFANDATPGQNPAADTVYLDDAAVVDTTATGSIIGGRCINGNPIPATFFGIDVNHGNNFTGMPDMDLGQDTVRPGLLRVWNSQCTWDYVESTENGGRNYSGVVEMFSEAGANTDIIYTVCGDGYYNKFSAPEWMEQYMVNDVPTDLDTSSRFATFLSEFADNVEDYGATIYYEVINELDFLNITPADVITLTDTVKTTVQNQDPAAKIVGPSITPFGMEGLDEFLFRGGGGMVDALAFHRYQNALPEVDAVLLTNLYSLMCTHNVTSATADVYEAEDGTLSGDDCDEYYDSGASGDYAVTGFRDGSGYDDYANSSCTITVNAASTGIYNLRIRYSNGFAGTGSVNLAINGGVTQTVYTPMTGLWGSSYAYADVWMPIGLNSGNNTLEFTSDNVNDGGINLDYISVAPLKPLFDTEGSAGGYMPGGSTQADDTNARGAIARRHILEWLFGVSKTAWYCWDIYSSGAWQYGNMCGTWWPLCESYGGDQIPNTCGQTYGITEKWLTGKTMTDWACMRNYDGQGNDVWLVDITSSGYNGYIMWAVGPSASTGVWYYVPGVWPVDYVHDLWGNNTAFTPPNWYLLKPSPVLFD